MVRAIKKVEMLSSLSLATEKKSLLNAGNLNTSMSNNNTWLTERKQAESLLHVVCKFVLQFQYEKTQLTQNCNYLSWQFVFFLLSGRQ